MSRTLNKMQAIGNLGRDPEVRETASGTRVASISIATTDGWGEKERTNWHRLTVFGKLADVVQKYLSKGDRIYVEGRMEYGSYERDGVTIPTAEIVVDQLIMLGGQGEPRKQATPVSDPGEPGDDLPF